MVEKVLVGMSGGVDSSVCALLLKEKGYTLMCAAKDLYLGTKYMSISDLSDELLISSDVFGLICNAIGIKRFGLKVLSKGEI